MQVSSWDLLSPRSLLSDLDQGLDHAEHADCLFQESLELPMSGLKE